MTHPCASKNPPPFCNRKKRRKSKRSCACPSGWTSVGIMCKKGRQMKRSSCAVTPKRKRKRSRR